MSLNNRLLSYLGRLKNKSLTKIRLKNEILLKAELVRNNQIINNFKP